MSDFCTSPEAVTVLAFLFSQVCHIAFMFDTLRTVLCKILNFSTGTSGQRPLPFSSITVKISSQFLSQTCWEKVIEAKIRNTIKILQKQIQRIDFETCKDALNPNVFLRVLNLFILKHISLFYIPLFREINGLQVWHDLLVFPVNPEVKGLFRPLVISNISA